MSAPNGSSSGSVVPSLSCEIKDSDKLAHQLLSSAMTILSRHLATCSECYYRWTSWEQSGLRGQASFPKPSEGTATSSGTPSSVRYTDNALFTQKLVQDTLRPPEPSCHCQTGPMPVPSSSSKPATCHSTRKRSKR